MKSNNIKSLEEVWKMKESVWNDYLKSGYKSYPKFIENDVLELKRNLKYSTDSNEKQKTPK